MTNVVQAGGDNEIIRHSTYLRERSALHAVFGHRHGFGAVPYVTVARIEMFKFFD
jgi:hypothetical protein